jgi:hypothetical protein
VECSGTHLCNQHSGGWNRRTEGSRQTCATPIVRTYLKIKNKTSKPLIRHVEMIVFLKRQARSLKRLREILTPRRKGRVTPESSPWTLTLLQQLCPQRGALGFPLELKMLHRWGEGSSQGGQGVLIQILALQRKHGGCLALTHCGEPQHSQPFLRAA